MDSTRLRYFVVVAETGNIRRAAELLFLSPAALSKAIKTLEGELGTDLVQRRGRGIVLTDAGRLLAARAAPLLAELAGIPDELSTRRRADRPLRYGSHEVFGTYFTRVLLAHEPRLSFEHRYLVPGAIERALLAHDIDLGISYIPMPTAGTDHAEAVRVPMGIYGLPAMTKLAFDDLRFAAPALPTIGSPVRAQGLDGWPEDRVPRVVPYRVTHTETALELCRSGHAVAYFPDFVVRLHNETTKPKHQLVEIEGPREVRGHVQPVYLVTRTGETPPALDAVREALATLGARPSRRR